jgi:glutamate-1-semialdehyde 2,1-aminomutase
VIEPLLKGVLIKMSNQVAQRVQEEKTYRRLPANPKPVDKSKVQTLMAQEWETFKKLTSGSARESALAKITTPLGVTSSFQYWDPHPISITSAQGAWMTDADGRKLLDLSMGFGAMLAGHLNPTVVEEIEIALKQGMLFVMPSDISRDAAERICRRFNIDQVRFANSGTEATMYATRIAKVVTGKYGVVKVEGGYHGSYDPFTTSAKPSLDKAGPAEAPTPAVIPGVKADDTYVVPFNNLAALERTFAAHQKDIACFIVEPVLENLGIVLPDEGYLQGVRDLCDKYGIVLIFDEVKTGLTAGPQGASQKLGVIPDLITLAKSIGGGVPVAAFGGKKEFMDAVTDNRMAHFGTFNGNPLAMAGVRAVDMIATADALNYATHLNYQALDEISDIVDEYELPAHTVGFGVKGCVTWSETPLRNYRDYKASDFEVAELSWLWSLNRNIITPPGLDEQWLVSLAHTQAEMDLLVEDFRALAKALRA